MSGAEVKAVAVVVEMAMVAMVKTVMPLGTLNVVFGFWIFNPKSSMARNKQIYETVDCENFQNGRGFFRRRTCPMCLAAQVCGGGVDRGGGQRSP